MAIDVILNFFKIVDKYWVKFEKIYFKYEIKKKKEYFFHKQILFLPEQALIKISFRFFILNNKRKYTCSFTLKL